MTHPDPFDHFVADEDERLAEQLGVEVRDAARAAKEAVRRLAHLTLGAPALPAPEVYFVLADLDYLGHSLAQSLRQLGVGLQRSLDVYDVTQPDATDPAAAVDQCVYELLQAVADATDLGLRIGRARNAIASQGHRGRRTPTPTTPSITDPTREG